MILVRIPEQRENLYYHASTLISPTSVSGILWDGVCLTHHTRCGSIMILQFVYCDCVVQADALSILPSSQSEDFLYPSVWEFRVSPKQNASQVSKRVTCKLLITAGRTELAQQHFDHDCPRSYCKFRPQVSV